MALPKPQLNGDVLAYDTLQTDALNDLEDRISNLVLSINPIGTIYESTTPTNPSSFIGGVWEEYGKGRVLVGIDSSQTEFNRIEKTGGEKTHTLTELEMPSHSHNIKHPNNGGPDTAEVAQVQPSTVTKTWGATMVATANTGGDQAHNNLQPYITVYRFRRIE